MKFMMHIFLMALIILPEINAQDSTFVLAEYVRMALQANTEIRSSQLAVEVSQHDSRINSTLPDPTFMIEGRGIPTDLSRVGETRELMFMLEQMFPPPGVLNHMQKRGEFAADIENEMRRAVEFDIIRQVKQIYYQLVYIDASIAINATHSKLLNDFEHIAESKYIVGKTGQQDLYQIKIDQARLETERLSLQENRANQSAALNRLLNRDLESIIQTEATFYPPVQFDSSEIKTLMEENNPFLMAARIRIESSENDIKLARANERPAFNIMGGYMVMNNADDALMGRVGMTLPFMPWSSKDTRVSVEKSHVLKNKADIDYQTLKDQFAIKLVEQRNALAALDHQIILYEKQIIPAAEKTVSLAIAGYQADTIDFLSLIQYEREKLNYELRRGELYSQYWQTAAQLEYVVGTTFEVIK